MYRVVTRGAVIRLSAILLALAFVLVPGTATGQSAGEAPSHDAFDLLIRGGNVLDGTGNPWFRADVGVLDGRIVAVGDLSGASAARELDATGLMVAPGFIDIHSHATMTGDDAWRRAAPSLVAQGITTVVVNQDGRSAWPIREQIETLRELGHGPNAVVLVGHGEVRRRAMEGDVARTMTDAELDRIRALVREGMEDGAWGFSAALEYNPGRYADTDEVVELAREVRQYGGVFVSHQRSEGSDPMWYWPSQDEPGPPNLIEAVLETIEIAERSGVPSVASHLKAKGSHYWGTSHTVVRLIEEARARGVPIYGDQYYYETTGSDGNTRLIPAWAVSRGQELVAEVAEADDGAEGVVDPEPADAIEALLAHPQLAADLRGDIAHEIRRRGGPDRLYLLAYPDEELVGLTLGEVAERWEVSPVEVAIRLQLEGDRSARGGARMRGYSLHEIDIEAYTPNDWMLTASDAGIGTGEGGLVHPRFYGTFPRSIARYARDLELMTMAHAVRAASSLPAQVLGMRDRGMVREGFHADLVLFHPDEIQDRATLFEPHQFPDGIPYVLVGGEFVVDDGEVTGALPGRVLTPETDR